MFITQVLRINSQFSARPEGTLSQSEATERTFNSQLCVETAAVGGS